MTLFLLL